MDFSYKFYNTTRSAWDGMSQAIFSAQKSIYWEIFTFIDDLAGKPFVDLLCAKAQAGLDVKIIADAFGSFSLSKESIFRLKASGVTFLIFNNFAPEFSLRHWMRRVWHRTHRKVLIIDREVVFIGGVNVAQFSANWHDLHMRLTGRIVVPILAGFARAYIRAGGDKKDVHDLLRPKVLPQFNVFKEKINFILHSPLHATIKSPFKDFYKQALNNAKDRFNLLTPYYVPDRNFLQLIAKAKKRGVNIHIIMPWRTDEKIMRYLASMFYGISAKAGAVFYFLKKMNHGKAVSVDNTLGMVGSANLTPRSFYINHEAGVVFSDQQMVDDLNQILETWKSEAVSLADLGLHNKIGWSKKFKDWWMNKIRNYV
jgi:cardiolipin synthase